VSRGPSIPTTLPGAVAWLLLYPDTYEIGLPNQGLQILYEILNERPDALAERAYAPWVDMEAAMRAAGIPLFSVEQHLPAAAFDVLAFNLSAELVYTNLLNMIDLAGLPLRGADRGGADALVVAGGHCVFNPEPLADFVDAFVLGDGEEVVGEINEVMATWLDGSPPESATARHSCTRWQGWRGCTCPRSTARRTRTGVWSRRCPSRPACPPRWPSGRSATWPTGPTRPGRSSR
jgi:hypothetical protein